MMRVFFTVRSCFSALFLVVLGRIVGTLDATFRASNNAIHCYPECQSLFQVFWISFRERVGFSSRHFQDEAACVNPCIDTPLTRLKEQSHPFVKWGDLAREKHTQQCVFHRSETGFPPTAIASLAGLLGDMVIIPVSMVRHGKGRQQCFKLRLIQASEGPERTGVVLEALRREHGGDLQPVLLDFLGISCPLSYHCFG
jgi:hypothetical protein